MTNSVPGLGWPGNAAGGSAAGPVGVAAESWVEDGALLSYGQVSGVLPERSARRIAEIGLGWPAGSGPDAKPADLAAALPSSHEIRQPAATVSRVAAAVGAAPSDGAAVPPEILEPGEPAEPGQAPQPAEAAYAVRHPESADVGRPGTAGQTGQPERDVAGGGWAVEADRATEARPCHGSRPWRSLGRRRWPRLMDRDTVWRSAGADTGAGPAGTGRGFT